MKHEPSLRIADDRTPIYIVSTVVAGRIRITFQRLGIDAQAVPIDVQEVHESGAVIGRLPADVTAPQEAEIHRALVQIFVI